MPITITIRTNGPLVIAADQAAAMQLVDHGGNPLPARAAADAPIALCRCGGSSTKPYCDGTHGRIGFIGTESSLSVRP